MALRKDIITDTDLIIKDGDFKVSDSDEQHITDIITSYPGWWKEFPQVGCSVADYQNSSGKQQELASKIKLQLQADDFTVDRPRIVQNENGTLTINPNAYRD